jgi:2-polyprenyl-3-methyl-5-hydroxy-6-metoxy-1,4-benzoquinol methylase
LRIWEDKLNNDLVTYYKNRAKEYEDIYFKPERQEELKNIEDILNGIFKEKAVIEIACGTGYWTERISLVAKSILATDINDSVLEIAKRKVYSRNNVIFKNMDLFSFNTGKKFESLFGGFIWSHIKLQELDKFIDRIKDLVLQNGTIVLIDNNYVGGSSSPVTNKDEFGNTYQTRKLKDGSNHLVLKNFPTEKFIQEKLEVRAEEINLINLKYYWILSYRI